MKKRLKRFAPRRVKEQDIRKLKYSMNFMGLLFIYVLIVLFFVWQHVRLTEIKYDIGKSKTDIKKKEVTVKELRIRRASLKNPGRIERIARSKLGMRIPQHNEVVRVRMNENKINNKEKSTDTKNTKEKRLSFLTRIKHWIDRF